MNFDLEEGYEKLKNRYETFIEKNDTKKILFTYEDALELDPGSNDFIFTGLPFFDREKYPNAALSGDDESESYQSRYTRWIENWTTPLILKLIDSLSPGGILAFNIGNSKALPLADVLFEDIKDKDIFKNNITPYTQSLWGKIFYGKVNKSRTNSEIIILQEKNLKQIKEEKIDNNLALISEEDLLSEDSDVQKPRDHMRLFRSILDENAKEYPILKNLLQKLTKINHKWIPVSSASKKENLFLISLTNLNFTPRRKILKSEEDIEKIKKEYSEIVDKIFNEKKSEESITVNRIQTLNDKKIFMFL